jgi:uncharacterized protein with NAD-binding domain and iron-sulfur cluster
VTTVAVLGGGVGGLSAAHELAQRGFKVTVYEHRDVFGGKARSLPVPGSGTNGRANLPAEHGFRFFPGFYRHLYDTMNRIPDGDRTVYHHLVTPKRMMIAQAGGRNEIIGPMTPPASFDDLRVACDFIWTIGARLGIPAPELVAFVERMLTFLTSCHERRIGQWERMTWWDFVDADHRSPAFKKFLATGMTRTLVAARAEEMSARTGASILWQLIFGTSVPGRHADGVLDGPTSEMWIDPWTKYLRRLGVELHGGYEVTKIDCDGRRITGVTVSNAAGPKQVKAEHYVAALPLERLRCLLTDELLAAEPRLRAVKDKRLTIRWMNGLMLYLQQDVPLVDGHILFVDSPWALTAISQKQFWDGIDLTRLGNGDVAGILSVDISDWCSKGLAGKPARACTKAEIHDDVWKQILAHIDDGSLQQSNVATWFLDPDIQFPNPGKATNAEPLLVNTADSWAKRPEAVTRIRNFFLASDFIQTNTDLATMEGANEAARRAVNGVLKATGSRAKPCDVWRLWEPSVLAPFRMADAVRWRLGLDVKLPVQVTPSGQLQPTDPAARTLLAIARRGGYRPSIPL